MSEQMSRAFMQAFERTIDSLERRMSRRQKQADSALESMLAQTRNGGDADPRSVKSYEHMHARAEEARLAYNAAIAEWNRARSESHGAGT